MSPINYFWIGESISPVEALALIACRSNGHQPVLWAYSKIRNVPEFVTVRDACELLDYRVVEYYANELQLPPANISDIFRYKLLRHVGGVYSDTDVVLVRNVDKIWPSDFFCSTFEYGDLGELASNCFMRIAAGSDAAVFMDRECDRRVAEIAARGRNDVHYCYLGPFLVQKCAKELHVDVLSYDYVNPVSWRWTNKIIAYKRPDRRFLVKRALRPWWPGAESRGYGLTQRTYAVHLCNDMWKQCGLDRNASFHPGSLYERLKRRYGT